MIYLKNVKRFCKEYWKVENYDQAVADESQVWDCHHRHEIDWALPRKELIAIGRYYDVHYSELIFLPHAEHAKLHAQVKDLGGQNNPMRGKAHTEETKQKMSAARKGENNPHYGKRHTEEWKQKKSEVMTKFHIPEEELYDLYIVQGLSQNQIADLYGCTQWTIWNTLKKYNIKK